MKPTLLLIAASLLFVSVGAHAGGDGLQITRQTARYGTQIRNQTKLPHGQVSAWMVTHPGLEPIFGIKTRKKKEDTKER